MFTWKNIYLKFKVQPATHSRIAYKVARRWWSAKTWKGLTIWFKLNVVDQSALILTDARVYFIIPTFTCLWLPRSPGCSAHSGSFLLFLSSRDLLGTTCLGLETTFKWRTKSGQKWIIVLWKLLGQWSRQPGQPTAAGSAQSIWNFGRLAWEPNFLQPGENTAFH